MEPRALSDSERINWVRLSRAPKVGPVTFFQLISRFKTAGAALDALPSLAKKKKLIPPPMDKVEAEIAAAAEIGARLVASCEPSFPPMLRALAPPPPLLTLLGNTELSAKPTIAIVGARNASAAGRKIARDMAADLGREGYVIVSGLARGIDGEAHGATLGTGTIAVLGGGIDHIYPRQHDRLYREVATRGLLVSESPLGYTAKAQDFPRRNRIVTGISRGVVVVEAAERSGSLISARTAGEQGRNVMAVPGSPLDPRAAGTNKLIRNGAVLVRDAADVIEAITTLTHTLFEPSAGDVSYYDAPTDSNIAKDLDRVREALTAHPMSIDDIADSAGLSAPACAALLIELELAGEAQTLAGGLACRIF